MPTSALTQGVVRSWSCSSAFCLFKVDTSKWLIVSSYKRVWGFYRLGVASTNYFVLRVVRAEPGKTRMTIRKVRCHMYLRIRKPGFNRYSRNPSTWEGTGFEGT